MIYLQTLVKTDRGKCRILISSVTRLSQIVQFE